MKKIENIRINYNLNSINIDDFSSSPINQFQIWFNEIIDSVLEPTAMTLSTYSKDDGVHNRVVLLKGIKKSGFIFYTNYHSLKGRQIELNNNVSLSFFWPKFQRQVRINGIAIKLSKKESSLYFDKRPRNSQIAAWVSNQSQIIENREILDLKFLEIEKKFKNKTIPKPDFWGGYIIKPVLVEFWQGRENRMHDRLLYKKKNNKWILNRLSP
tara:strand:+ start:200 stop:835 length:636 start_codon:yes stop_codon:yes gene_type:complete